MNLKYELNIIDLDSPDDSMMVHEYSGDIEDIKTAIHKHEYERDEMIGGRNDNN